jgi:methylated-DNA-[protein]-cysteine S-methyltransferase
MDKTEIISAPGFSLELRWSGHTLTGTRLLPRRQWGTAAKYQGFRHPELARALVHYSSRTWPILREVKLPLKELSDFKRRVLTSLRLEVPFGATITYGELARMSGSPGAARAVGRCMALNPWPILVPCHRVLGQNSLGGFGSGLSVKKTLLRLEGIKA